MFDSTTRPCAEDSLGASSADLDCDLGPALGGVAAARKPRRTRTAAAPARRLLDHRPSLERYARHLCRRSHDAQDLVQETFLRALCHHHQLRSEGAERAWLYQVMRRTFLSECRAARVRSHYAERARAAGQQPVAPVALFLTKSTERALHRLPPQYSQTLRLVDLLGHTYQEAAVALGVPVGTVMSRLHRARRLLADSLTAPTRSLDAPSASLVGG